MLMKSNLSFSSLPTTTVWINQQLRWPSWGYVRLSVYNILNADQMWPADTFKLACKAQNLEHLFCMFFKNSSQHVLILAPNVIWVVYPCVKVVALQMFCSNLFFQSFFPGISSSLQPQFLHRGVRREGRSKDCCYRNRTVAQVRLWGRVFLKWQFSTSLEWHTF